LPAAGAGSGPVELAAGWQKAEAGAKGETFEPEG